MKLKWDPENDALYFRLDDAEIIESEEIKPGLIVDYDNKNQIIGFELLRVSKHVLPEKLKILQFETV